MPYDFENCKNCSSKAAQPKYRLSGKSSNKATVWVCSDCGFHYIGFLDAGEVFDPVVRYDHPDCSAQIQNYDFQNRQMEHVKLIQQMVDLQNAKVLDVGCGSGTFLSLLKQKGADVTGLELYDPAIVRAKAAGLTVYKYPVEHEFWQNQFAGSFDLISMWDVIEHVNFPVETCKAATRLLRPGGLLFISTPCRDSFYYRFGQITYRLSMGKWPTFLNVLYANKSYGHKQIFSTGDIKQLYHRSGLEILFLKKDHELSLPYRNYLKKKFRSETIVNMTEPIVRLFFQVCRIRNKLIAIGKKGAQR